MNIHQIQITISNELTDQINTVIYLLKNELKVKNMIVLTGENNSLIMFRRSKVQLPVVMERLHKIGVGVDFGIIDILPLTVTIPEIVLDEKDESNQKEQDIHSRVTLEEIQNYINEMATIDLHFYIFIILAALVAGSGLLKNSPAVIIASMLLSPFMGPILGVSYGIVIKNRKNIENGLRGQLYSIGIIIAIGLIMGLFTLLFDPTFIIPAEMTSRTFPNILDMIIAVGGGIAVGFCITASIRSAFVGISIAVSLLPPIVNTGIAIALGQGELAFGSFLLMLTNVILINVSAVVVFKLKRIQALPQTAHDWIGTEEKFLTKKKKEPIVEPVQPVQQIIVEPKGRFAKIRSLFGKKSNT